ncbi:ubiquitin family [Chlorella sorokiniana]|uniref:Ubiquitin family n=1 Tax=Chlorella sorokiniana TaxID=3076 RepID=A0A2P6TW90_CHLSO|nr:ubiquitin family [Chlorella sorokiniana]|eukprot:PRW58332.1 ubiquitin family [Chlorella sorokiniana]
MSAAAAHACWVWVTPGAALLSAALYLALAHIVTAGLLRSSSRDLASCWAEARSMAAIVANACFIPGAGLCLAASALWSEELQDYDPVVKLLTAFVVTFGSAAVQCCIVGGVLLLVHGTRSAGCSGADAAAPALCGIAAGVAVGLLLFGMELTVIAAAGRRKETLELAQTQLSEAALRAAVVRQLGLAPPAAAQLRLVHKGQPLADDEAVSRLQDGDTVLAAVAPRPPPKAVREAVSGGGLEDEDDDPLRLRLPANAPAWKRSTVGFLRQRLHVPEAVLALLLSVSLRAWLALAAWMAGARLAARWDLGPLYIIATILLLMLLNLGQRREGQWSAYSLFNPGMRRLPGQMTAEDLDRQVRRGQM